MNSVDVLIIFASFVAVAVAAVAAAAAAAVVSIVVIACGAQCTVAIQEVGRLDALDYHCAGALFG